MYAVKRRRNKRKREVPTPEPSKIFSNKDIVKNIFEFLPSLKSVSLVSHLFLDVALELREGKNCIWIRSEDDIDDNELFRSMMNTKRVCGKAAIGESSGLDAIDCYDNVDEFLNELWYLFAVGTVFQVRHGQHLKELQLMNVKVSICNLLTLLKFTPNLKLLKLFFVHTTNDEMDPGRISKLPEDFLSEIPDLILVDCGPSVEDLIEYLPENSVRSLTIKANELSDFRYAIKDQLSIVKLNLICTSITPLPSDSLEDLKLTHLTLDVRSAQNASDIIGKQKNLKFLDVSQTIIDNETFSEITQLPRLETLLVDASGISHHIFVSIAKLKSLKHLTLNHASEVYLIRLMRLGGVCLETFNVVNAPLLNRAVMKVRKKLVPSKDPQS